MSASQADAGHHLAPPFPPYLQPSSRQGSYHSQRSARSLRSQRSSHSHVHPHPQHREYVPAAPEVVAASDLDQEAYDIRERFDEAGQSAPFLNDDTPSGDGERESAAGESEVEIAQRQKWRRAHPNWILPFVLVTATTLGMCMAPRSELFINLACLAHPPQQHKELDFSAVSATFSHIETRVTLYDDLSASTPSVKPALSVADEWFIRLQRDIYEYKFHHKALPGNSTYSSPSVTAFPTEPLPAPPYPTGQAPVEFPQEPPTKGGNSDEPSSQGPPYQEIDPSLCKHDPKVQAAAAKITMIMTLTMGTLAALTTGFWGQTSDRVGRTKVLGVVSIGLFINDLNFVLVASFPHLAPGGYRALLIGPTIDGFLGGFSTLQATFHAYTSDVTPDGSRQAVFARLMGVIMTGFALGPILGTYIINLTGNIMTPFYISAAAAGLWVPVYLFVLPESLSSEARQELKTLRKDARARSAAKDALDREWEAATPNPMEDETDPLLASPQAGTSGWASLANATHAGYQSKRRKRLAGNFRRLLRRMFAFARPLGIFLPREREDGRGKDWSLTLTGLAMFLGSILFGLLGVKTQFTFYAYGWTSAELGPYISLTAVFRTLVLLVLIPGIMHYVKPHFAPPDANESAVSFATEVSGHIKPDNASTAGSSGTSTPHIVLPRIAPKSAILDLWTYRISLAIDMTFYALLATNPSPMAFVLLSVGLTLGSGSAPAANSLALSLVPSSQETGRLFGALSVLSALGTTLLGPLIFGSIYASTVGWYAPTIFAVAAGILAVAIALICCIRLPGHGKRDVESSGKARQRGRSRKVKRTSMSGGGSQGQVN